MGHQVICGFGAPQSHDDGERDGESGGERDLPEIYVAACDAADRRKNDQAKHVVNDRGGQNNLTGDFMEKALGGKHGRGDADTSGHHGSADKNGLDLWHTPGAHDSPAGEKRDDDAEGRDESCFRADFEELGGFDFQSNAEEQKHHAEIGQRFEGIVRSNPSQDAGADQRSGKNFADDPRLAETFANFGQQFRRTEDDQHRER